ncbi:undecaprenyl-phosphate glucose phosphotransferase [Pedobacter jejuensis]|uniref:Undecaprenyl-phosphate glucose phosphotransferase n=1 Tax=Pedobacter jejuensis TaxID=1268550 RepID=A0A3N0C3J9_9SPHI|nr:undecaprenyl-phosphate glucose phosphotransferase [Pedobacter jejuensis]RNL56927.1 undecaprenyl-phosphate glucose phosphotransferase [Pedobacter jejuensis]
MIESNSTYFKTISILIDLFLVNMAGYFGYVLANGTFGMFDGRGINFLHILLINFVWFNVTQITKLYQDMFVKDAIPTIKQALWSLLLFGTIIFLLVVYLKDFSVSYRLLIYTGLLFAPLFLAGKVVFLLLRRSSRAKLINYKKVVIVGAGPLGLDLKNHLEKNTHLGYKVVGFFDDAPEKRAQSHVIGSVDECIDYVKESNIKEIYCALPDRALKKIDVLMRQADKAMIRFKLVPDVKDYFKKNVMVQLYGHLPVLSPRTEPLEIFSNQVVKRIFDVVFSSLIIIFVMSWLVPIMAILIKMESKGPVFFKQLRSGKDNHSFYCLKFRSMYVNGEADTKQASAFDSRVTKIGAFMRKKSIDEMPQFFNVLFGEMSVVGPRPHMLQHTAEYSALIDQFMVRHFLLPGITGWAQVNGLRGETKEDGSMEERVEADIWYLENWSLLLDLKITFLTIWQVLAGHNKAH